MFRLSSVEIRFWIFSVSGLVCAQIFENQKIAADKAALEWEEFVKEGGEEVSVGDHSRLACYS